MATALSHLAQAWVNQQFLGVKTFLKSCLGNIFVFFGKYFAITFFQVFFGKSKKKMGNQGIRGFGGLSKFTLFLLVLQWFWGLTVLPLCLG